MLFEPDELDKLRKEAQREGRPEALGDTFIDLIDEITASRAENEQLKATKEMYWSEVETARAERDAYCTEAEALRKRLARALWELRKEGYKNQAPDGEVILWDVNAIAQERQELRKRRPRNRA